MMKRLLSLALFFEMTQSFANCSAKDLHISNIHSFLSNASLHSCGIAHLSHTVHVLQKARL
ncbi:hypothetical protein [Selenomonas sp.]|uniref:hypothetical protein n=1 Tax=Selenomonas sp. TaxID=2053611 RepID=UPI0025DE5C51|nr:hypothetical protein [Selenomonas sp.]